MPQWRHNVSDRKSYTELQTPENHQVHQQILALTIKRSGQDTGYGARMKKTKKALILVLGLLQVVSTVETVNILGHC